MATPIAVWGTDPHLTKDNVEQVEAVLRQGIDLAADSGANCFILGGDLFTSRIGQPLAPLDCVYRLKAYARKRKVRIYAIAGNHDKGNLDSTRSFLAPFNSSGFKVFSRPGHFDIGDTRFYMLPYFKEQGKYPKYLEDLSFHATGSDMKYCHLMTHIAINGVVNNDGSAVVNDLVTDRFNAFNTVIVGHYHNASSFKNILYTGSTHPQNYGEDNNKGFTIIFDDGTTQHIKVTFSEYHTVFLQAEDVTPATLGDLADQKVRNGSHIRVVVHGDKAKLSTVSKQQFNRLGLHVKLESTEQIEEMAQAVRKEAVSFSISDISAQFDHFCGRTKLTKEEIAIGRSYLAQIK